MACKGDSGDKRRRNPCTRLGPAAGRRSSLDARVGAQDVIQANAWSIDGQISGQCEPFGGVPS
jgi:hypothetical protein